QGAEDQEIERALEELELFGVVSGHHSTRESTVARVRRQPEGAPLFELLDLPGAALAHERDGVAVAEAHPGAVAVDDDEVVEAGLEEGDAAAELVAAGPVDDSALVLLVGAARRGREADEHVEAPIADRADERVERLGRRALRVAGPVVGGDAEGRAIDDDGP